MKIPSVLSLLKEKSCTVRQWTRTRNRSSLTRNRVFFGRETIFLHQGLVYTQHLGKDGDKESNAGTAATHVQCLESEAVVQSGQTFLTNDVFTNGINSGEVDSIAQRTTGGICETSQGLLLDVGTDDINGCVHCSASNTSEETSGEVDDILILFKNTR